ncbi:MAG: hypothetical protein A2W11_04340 [Ignavibacteria bacterium RBG_16_35_7]|nr:MAG: hypothetical protein A2W11_04340 [Ignavibacteria bacterium RBG_16_35_7]
MFEFLKSNIDYVYEIIAESLLVFFKPRAYLLLIARESAQASVKRVLFLTILYIIITVALISVFFPERLNFSYLQLIGIGFFEILLAILAVILLFITKFSFETKISIRQIIVFLLTAKFIMIPFILVPYLLFLKTENYTFILFRAFIVYFYIIFFLLILPMICNYKVWRRIFSTLALFFSLAIIGQLIVISLYKAEPIWFSIKKLTLLYDPIGNECLSIVETIKEYDSSLNISEFAINYIKSLNVSEKDSMVILSMQRSVHDSIFQGWNKKSTTYQHNLSFLRKFIDSCNVALRYRTSKNLISLADDVVLSDKSLLKVLDKIFVSSDSLYYGEFYSSLLSTLKKGNSFVSHQKDILENLLQLRKYFIIII